MSRNIKVFVAGEVIDREFDPASGTLKALRSFVPKIIKDAHLELNISIDVLMLCKLTLVEHAEFVMGQITKHDGPVIIVCDISNILDLADHIADNRHPSWQQPVILTGARIPYTQSGSDAAFNIGCAITAARFNVSECGSTQIALNGLIKSSRYIDRNSII